MSDLQSLLCQAELVASQSSDFSDISPVDTADEEELRAELDRLANRNIQRQPALGRNAAFVEGLEMPADTAAEETRRAHRVEEVARRFTACPPGNRASRACPGTC